MPVMDRARAEDGIAVRFSRVMNATPSPWGFVSDLVIAAAASSLIVFAGFLVIARLDCPAAYVWTVFAVAAIPLVASFVVSLVLAKRSRPQVVAWLASLPFDVVNLNAVLAGAADTVEVVFAEPVANAAPVTLPTRAELTPKLDAIHPGLFLVDERPEIRMISIRIGIVDSKRNPYRTNHARWVRLCTLVSAVLIPMHRERHIERLQIA
jgi:hypothetical protein